jgi:hypothetical protein
MSDKIQSNMAVLVVWLVQKPHFVADEPMKASCMGRDLRFNQRILFEAIRYREKDWLVRPVSGWSLRSSTQDSLSGLDDKI